MRILNRQLRQFVFQALAALILLGSVTAPAWSDEGFFINNSVTAAKVRVDLIREAQSEILVSTHWFTPDRSGLMLLKELMNAARQGKRVVILIDALYNQLTDAQMEEAQRVGVEIYNYRPFRIKNMLQIFRRMHDKLFVVDRSHLISGDRNIKDDYFGIGENTVVSKEFYLHGQVAEEVASYFNEMIERGPVEKVQTKPPSNQELLIARRLIAEAKVPTTLNLASAWRSNIHDFGEVRFYHNPVVPTPETENQVAEKITQALRSAQESVTVENPYILLTPKMQRAMLNVREKDLPLKIFTNSMHATDHKSVWLGWTASREFLSHIGAEIWEHPGKTVRNLKMIGSAMIHAKTIQIDGKHLFIMSYNLDPRSEFLNTETVFHFVDSPQAVKEAASIQEKEIRRLGYRRVASDNVLLNQITCVQRTIRKLLLGSPFVRRQL